MAAESPLSIAHAKKVLFTASLTGRPKETFDTPRDVWHPSSWRITSRALRVAFAAD